MDGPVRGFALPICVNIRPSNYEFVGCPLQLKVWQRGNRQNKNAAPPGELFHFGALGADRSTWLWWTCAAMDHHRRVAVLLTALLAPALAQQCAGGEPSCACITSYEGFNVSTNDGELMVQIDDEDHVYGIGYGLHSCKAHDSSTAPFCNAAGFPSFCTSYWCYVNVSSCALSALPSSYTPGLHYSHDTCEAADTFTSFYTQRNGHINLCSVFSTPSDARSEASDVHQRQACGNTDTRAQVEAAVAAANALNDGQGFALRGTGGDAPRVTRYYRFNYAVRTYPSGQWAAVGSQLSADLFSSDACDLVVGMANGCPNAEITAQALLANASKRIYVTGCGPEAVLRERGDNQPYLFSSQPFSTVFQRF